MFYKWSYKQFLKCFQEDQSYISQVETEAGLGLL